MKISDLWQLARQTFAQWSEDKAPRLAAALSYYTVFSIPPLLVFLISLVGRFLGSERVRQALLAQIGDLLTAETAEALGEIIDSATRPVEGTLATGVGLAILLLGASGVFSQLHDALNTIWEVTPKAGGGILGLLRKRFFSFLLVLATSFTLLVSLVLSTALAALSEFIQPWLPASTSVVRGINFAFSFLVIISLFALIFKFVPDASIRWRDVWPGAGLTALLFEVGKALISFYLARSNLASTFGAAASIILVLVWVYYSAQILFIGAEFTQVYANTYGAGIQPDEHAERVSEAQRAQQGIPRTQEYS
jgi:membrane protein